MGKGFKEGTGFCSKCKDQVLTRRETRTTNHILHFLITILSCGVWVFVWAFLVLNSATARFPQRCTRCGSKV